MKLYRLFFEAKGWSPDRLNRLTPKQLIAIAGRDEGGRKKSYRSIAEAAADYAASEGSGS